MEQEYVNKDKEDKNTIHPPNHSSLDKEKYLDNEEEENDDDSIEKTAMMEAESDYYGLCSKRKRPNILVTGTPGVGKTSTADRIAEELELLHISIGDMIRQHDCYDGYDDELQTHILNEDKLLDILEPIMMETEEDMNVDLNHKTATEEQEPTVLEKGGRIVDYHACELFPQRWFDLVLVLRTDTHVLYDRLTVRGYNHRKREENMTCEIMGVVLEEAQNSYDMHIVQEIQSNTLQDLDETIRRVKLWYDQWMFDNKI